MKNKPRIQNRRMMNNIEDLRLQMRKLEEILITEHNIAIYDRV